MAKSKPKTQPKSKPKNFNQSGNEQLLDGGSDDSKRSGGFDPLLGYTAVGGAALSAGYIASKTMQAGLPNRLKNTLLNRSVVVHGTGRPIVGNKILPKAGSPGSPNEAVVFSWNPKFSPPDQKWIGPSAGEYAGRSYFKDGVEMSGQGNVVIGTVKNKDLVKGELKGSPMAVSKGPLSIKKVIKYDSNTAQYQKNLERALHRQGIRVKPNLKEIRGSKKQAAELAKRLRISNKNSPV